MRVVLLTVSCARFDKEGFSIWRVDFKYPEELTQVFMSSNQIGGFYSTYLFCSARQSGQSLYPICVLSNHATLVRPP